MEPEPKTHYSRNLPHIQPLGGTFDLNFCLDGFLPMPAVEKLQELRAQLRQALQVTHPDLSPEEIIALLRSAPGLYYGKYDELLDDPLSGPRHLAFAPIANLVVGALHYWHGRKYKLVCYCIMSNHVHLVISDTTEEVYKILKSIKNFTARLANQMLGRSGTAFWLHESWDHVVRNEQELKQRIQYNLLNPVKAGLVEKWSDYAYAYLNPEYWSYQPE